MQQKLDDLHLLVQSGGVCVMVEGCGGCGKTALLKAYARARGYSIGDNLVIVHLGEQIDGKVHGVVCYTVETENSLQMEWMFYVVCRASQSKNEV